MKKAKGFRGKHMEIINGEKGYAVAKFGGSSVANAEQIAKVKDILNQDNTRRFIVVSAPGKDVKFNHKVTDVLYNLYYSVNKFRKPEFPNYDVLEGSPGVFCEMIIERFANLSSDLGISKNIRDEVKDVLSIKNVADSSEGYIVSRGEYFTAKIIAEYINADFADAADLIKLRKDGTVITEATSNNIKSISNSKSIVVIPGFYGSLAQSGDIRAFSRGGSDLSGSIVADGVDAALYENWTDRDGIYACDPRLFGKDELKGRGLFVIPKMSYKETRELTYMGFEVFNDESLGPLLQKKIPLVIKNTNKPDAPGTFISEDYDKSRPVRGIAGKNGFCSINVEKYLMNKSVGFGAKLLNILYDYGINFEHAPSGIDSISVVLEQAPFDRYKRDILGDIKKSLSPDSVIVKEHLGLVAVVGEGLKGNGKVSAEVMKVLSKNGIETEIISQGASENNIILGVNAEDYRLAIKSLYCSLIEMR